jgi:hypothetical protein
MKRKIPITFGMWWMQLNKKRKIEPYMKEIILADFKGRGLTENEDIDTYNDALKKFGL